MPNNSIKDRPLPRSPELLRFIGYIRVHSPKTEEAAQRLMVSYLNEFGRWPTVDELDIKLKERKGKQMKSIKGFLAFSLTTFCMFVAAFLFCSYLS